MHAARHSRAVRGPSRRRAVLLGASAVAAIATTAVLVAGRGAASTDAAPSCPPGAAPLVVRAAPEIAPVVADVVRIAAGPAMAPGCPAPRVLAEDPAAVADAIAAERTDRPDVWIPDSSLWTHREGAALPEGTSIARTPVVLAVPDAVARRVARPDGTLYVGDLVPRREGDPTRVRWALTDAARSATSVAALLALRDVTEGRSAGDALTATVLRAGRRDLPPDVDAQLSAAAGSALAVPTSEQGVDAYRRRYPSAPGLVTAVLPAPGYSLDYPFVVLAAQQARRAQADALLSRLRGELGRRLLQAAGFRDAEGLAGAGTTTPAFPDTGRVLQAPAAAQAVRALRSVVSGSRLLAVVDVSGSMATPAPGARGANRLDLALQASSAGLSLYPDDTQVGLWTFSTRLTPTTDYARLVPIGTLGRRTDGTTGRERVARALSAVHVKRHGDTGLYDTVLAAVREVRHGWDPTRVNSVVVITDGADDDPGGIGLPRLLRTLREADPARPVPVFSIAYGPSGDRRSLAAIGAATGGRTYVARDPRAIDDVLLDAIGRRAR